MRRGAPQRGKVLQPRKSAFALSVSRLIVAADGDAPEGQALVKRLERCNQLRCVSVSCRTHARTRTQPSLEASMCGSHKGVHECTADVHRRAA